MKLQGALSAAAILTRVPMPRSAHTGDLGSAAPWMPTVGAAIGALSALAFVGLRPFGPGTAAAAAVSTSIILTGCLHEDGLADTADALGGAGTRERVFEILKDSRIGTFGAVAVALSLIWRTVLIGRLGDNAAGAIVAAHTIGRLATVWMMARLDYVTPPSVARHRVARRLGTRSAAQATVSAALVLLILSRIRLLPPTAWIIAVVSFAGVAALLALYFKHRCGGYTGDFLGATEQVGECWTLLMCVVATTARGATA